MYTHICKRAKDAIGRLQRNDRQRIEDRLKSLVANTEDKTDKEIRELLKRLVVAKNLIRLKCGNWRIAAQFESVDVTNDHRVLVLFVRAVLSHPSEEDKLLWKQGDNWMEKHPLPAGEKKDAARDLLKTAEDDGEESVPPHEQWDELCVNVEIDVLESLEWVERIEKFEDWRLKMAFDIVGKIADLPVESDYGVLLPDQPNTHRARLCIDENLAVLYEKFPFRDDRRGTTFLWNVSKGRTQPKESRLKEILSKYDVTGAVSYEDIAKYAERGYSGDWVLGDEQLWDRLQKGREVNLALSEEEKDILQDPQMPAYISGRAGSGKTTMLRYFFAEAIRQKYDSNREGIPLFVTYSDGLAGKTKDLVLSMLENNSQFSEYIRDDQWADLMEWFDDSVLPFVPFVREHFLTVSERRGRFKIDHRVIYNDFRDEYLDSCYNVDKAKYPSELVWHALRSFIKGYSTDGWLSPQEYRERVDRKERTVELEHYETVFEEIWKSWYKTWQEQTERWDDLDLIRYVLNNWESTPEPRKFYPVIICDEAQDFTRIELDFILRISPLVLRGRSGEDEHSPERIAFGGDVFQCIYPTGFREERITSMYFELSGTGQHLTPRVLEKNYRSAPPTVGVSNFIQYYRRRLPGHYSIKPQQCFKAYLDVPSVMFFSVEESHVRQVLGELDLNKVVIVVPAEEGGETTFVEEDELLKKLLGSDTRYLNVATPATVKGSEFSQPVVLYKFGDFSRDTLEVITSGSLPSHDYTLSQEQYAPAHFMNKAYVAITRAQRRVFILDTDNGWERFWTYFSKKEYDTIFPSSETTDEIWSGDFIDYVRRGSREHLLDLRGDPDKTANELMSRGLELDDPKLLMMAWHFFTQAIDVAENVEEKKDFTLQSKVCRARAHSLLREWLEASEIHIELFQITQEREYYMRAAQCLWKGHYFSKLKELDPKHLAQKGRNWRSLAQFMENEMTFHELLNNNLADNFDSEDTAYEEIVKKLLQEMEEELQ